MLAFGLPLVAYLLALHFLLASLLIARTQLRGASRRLRVAVRQRTRELEQVNRELAELANLDPLTGLFNRRAFMQLAGARVQEAVAAGERCFVLMADLDHFKAINDRHGHAAGDMVLRGAARCIADAVRRGDLVRRLGGEEFAALVRGGSLDDARACGERILAAMRAMPVVPAAAGVTADGEPAVAEPASGATAPADPAPGPVACSIGIAEVAGTALERALRDADDALYRAKARGRARVEVAGDDRPAAPATPQTSG